MKQRPYPIISLALLLTLASFRSSKAGKRHTSTEKTTFHGQWLRNGAIPSARVLWGPLFTEA